MFYHIPIQGLLNRLSHPMTSFEPPLLSPSGQSVATHPPCTYHLDSRMSSSGRHKNSKIPRSEPLLEKRAFAHIWN